MTTLLESLKTSPELPNLLDEMNAFFQDERQKRQDFYEQITPDDKAEFINGEAIFHSPVRLMHNFVSSLLHNLILNYVNEYEIGLVGIEKLMISLSRNDYEPDICFFSNEKAEHFQDDQLLFPAPDFIVEVLSKSTEKRDRGIKKADYALHGVKEYWIVEPDKRFVERYLLEDREYNLVETVVSGNLVSDVISGFSVPLEAIFDRHANKIALRKILADNN